MPPWHNLVMVHVPRGRKIFRPYIRNRRYMGDPIPIVLGCSRCILGYVKFWFVADDVFPIIALPNVMNIGLVSNPLGNNTIF